MSIKDLFHKIVHAAGIAVKDIGKVLVILENEAPLIEQWAEKAMTIIADVDQLAPNRTFDELKVLADKFSFHLTPELASNPDEVETLMQNSVLALLRKVEPEGTPANRILRSAISLAFNTFKAHKTVGV